MRKVMVPGAALVLLGGCAGNPPAVNPAVYYIPGNGPSWSPAPRAYYGPAPRSDYAPAPVDPPRYAVQSPERVTADPVNAPLRGVPAGDDCGWWRLCNLPGWRYED